MQSKSNPGRIASITTDLYDDWDDQEWWPDDQDWSTEDWLQQDWSTTSALPQLPSAPAVSTQPALTAEATLHPQHQPSLVTARAPQVIATLGGQGASSSDDPTNKVYAFYTVMILSIPRSTQGRSLTLERLYASVRSTSARTTL